MQEVEVLQQQVLVELLAQVEAVHLLVLALVGEA
jgi:hypothetical protein